MTYYPIYLHLAHRTVLLVGAGEVARQKLPALLDAGAQVRLVAPEALPEVEAFVRAHEIDWRSREYETADLDGSALVIAATDDPALQKRIAAEARERGIWVNIVDVTPLCDFIAPAVVSRGDLQIAISTGGAAPALAKQIRKKLESLIGPEYGALVELLKRYRPKILALPKAQRETVWNTVVSEDFIREIQSRGLSAAEEKLNGLVHGKSAV